MSELVWRKSSFSDSQGTCVEVARAGARMLVRATAHAGRGPTLSFTQPEWEAWVNGVRAGEFPWDLPA